MLYHQQKDLDNICVLNYYFKHIIIAVQRLVHLCIYTLLHQTIRLQLI